MIAGDAGTDPRRRSEGMYTKEALEWVYQETKECRRLYDLAERNRWPVVLEQAQAKLNMLEWLQGRLLLEVGE